LEILLINLNTATATELDKASQLKGHGFEIARYREERGRFDEVRQLEEVPGLAGKGTEQRRPSPSIDDGDCRKHPVACDATPTAALDILSSVQVVDAAGHRFDAWRFLHCLIIGFHGPVRANRGDQTK
jgi:competence protein ComEA